jgi:hypothetical protein
VENTPQLGCTYSAVAVTAVWTLRISAGTVKVAPRRKHIFFFVFCVSHGGRLRKVKVEYNLEEATKSQRGNRGVALLFL